MVAAAAAGAGLNTGVFAARCTGLYLPVGKR